MDVHVSYWVWSLLVLTQWKTTPQVSCRACGVKKQLAGAAFSLGLGWWGIPWGLLMTPLQIVRNLTAVFNGPEPTQPSPQLERVLRVNIGAQAARAASSGAAWTETRNRDTFVARSTCVGRAILPLACTNASFLSSPARRWLELEVSVSASIRFAFTKSLAK